MTSEQKHRIEDLNQKYESQFKKLTHSLREGSNNFQIIINSNTATDEQIRDKYRRMLYISQQLGNINLENQLAIRNVLTVEQRKQRTAIMNASQELKIASCKPCLMACFKACLICSIVRR